MAKTDLQIEWENRIAAFVFVILICSKVITSKSEPPSSALLP